ncbi:MAG: hypothetical protein ACI814_000338 [Mariniblastus sp.]|jgi:hypothetical protein
MSEDNTPDTEPKIIVDDDWKSQVEQEKEQLQEQVETPEVEAEGEAESYELPPANFMVLMSTLATQAMGAMGLIPDPATGQPSVNLPMAKHFIDMLAMLQEKTKGNLDEEESGHLRDGLHQLRMIYVSSDKPQAGAEEAEQKSSIELP